MHTIKVFLSIICFFALFPYVSSAITWDSDYIEALAKTYLESEILPPDGGKIFFYVSEIDPRIRINPCLEPLKATIPDKTNRRNINVKISCEDSTPWRIYLPAKIERTFAVVVAKSTIEKGEILTHKNIGIDYVAKNKIRGERLTNMNSILGSKAEKRIGEKNTITNRDICLVCKGDAITIIAKTDNFMIKTKGTALSSGNLNQQIRVKNSRSGRVIKPKISAVNQVTIHL